MSDILFPVLCFPLQCLFHCLMLNHKQSVNYQEQGMLRKYKALLNKYFHVYAYYIHTYIHLTVCMSAMFVLKLVIVILLQILEFSQDIHMFTLISLNIENSTSRKDNFQLKKISFHVFFTAQFMRTMIIESIKFNPPSVFIQVFYKYKVFSLFVCLFEC